MHGGRGVHERGFRFALHYLDQRIELVQPRLGILHRFEQSRIRTSDCLLDLAHVPLDDGDDFSRILCNVARAPYKRGKVLVNAIQQIVHLFVSLPELPRNRDQNYGQHQNRYRRQSADDRGDCLKSSRCPRHLPRDECVRQNVRQLVKQRRNVRDVVHRLGWCKGEASPQPLRIRARGTARTF